MSQAWKNLIPAVIFSAIFFSLVLAHFARARREQSRVLDIQRNYQNRIVEIMEAQLKGIDQQSAALERIAAALERTPQSN
jgi:hypothetical protein